MTWLWLSVGILATYRLSRMIAIEDGPADVFSEIRERVGQETWIGRGLNCTLCVSFWIAFPVALLLPVASPGEYLITALALSAGTVILHKVIA